MLVHARAHTHSCDAGTDPDSLQDGMSDVQVCLHNLLRRTKKMYISARTHMHTCLEQFLNSVESCLATVDYFANFLLSNSLTIDIVFSKVVYAHAQLT